jgi:hypothetical protein
MIYCFEAFNLDLPWHPFLFILVLCFMVISQLKDLSRSLDERLPLYFPYPDLLFAISLRLKFTGSMMNFIGFVFLIFAMAVITFFHLL